MAHRTANITNPDSPGNLHRVRWTIWASLGFICIGIIGLLVTVGTRQISVDPVLQMITTLDSKSFVQSTGDTKALFAHQELHLSAPGGPYVMRSGDRLISRPDGWQLQHVWDQIATQIDKASAQSPCLAILYRGNDNLLVAVTIKPVHNEKEGYLLIARAYKRYRQSIFDYGWRSVAQHGFNQLEIVDDNNAELVVRSDASVDSLLAFRVAGKGDTDIGFELHISPQGFLRFSSNDAQLQLVEHWPNRWLRMDDGRQTGKDRKVDGDH